MSGETCRVCLENSWPSISLFDYQNDEQYYKKLTFCTNLDIAEDDGLPPSICEKCVSELSVSYSFILKCHESDKRLRTEVKEEKTFCDGDIAIFDEIEQTDDLCGDIVFDFDLDADEGLKKKKHKLRKSQKKHKKGVVCNSCGLRVASKAAMIIHMRKHTGEKPYKCPHCEMKFSQTGTLKVHIERRHSSEPRHLRERPFSCETCGGNFFSKRDLTVHLRRHTGDHPYSCEECNQRFTQMGSLIRHKRIHTGERPYQCKLCPKSFIDSNLLNKHQYVHTDEKRFTCPVCGKAIKAKYSLDKHLELHKEKRPVMCEICGITRSNQTNLKTHIKRHHSEKSGQCDVCNKHCTDLTAHMRKHTGENVFICAVCGKGFPLKISLAVHMHKHRRLTKFQCDKENCTQKFSKKSQLEIHILKFHQDSFSGKKTNESFK